MSHDGITTFDFDGRSIPCILFEQEHYNSILSDMGGNPVSIETTLNILQDGLGHVFVEVVLSLPTEHTDEKILINANRNLDFFASLAETSMLAICPKNHEYGGDSIFVINMPRPDKARDAFEMIKRGLEAGINVDGAVTGI